MATIEELLLTAVSIARSAGQLAKEKWGQPLEMTSKGFRDIVTDADVYHAGESTSGSARRECRKRPAFEEPASHPIVWITSA